jgi:tetratricopeptide (TPR) repeat protein
MASVVFILWSWITQVIFYFQKKIQEQAQKKQLQDTAFEGNTEEIVAQLQEQSAEAYTPDTPNELSHVEKQELQDFVKLIQTKIARGEYAEARQKIIEGLSIDKFHKDLNCLLASMYEGDKDYRKAEILYRDLILVHEHDTELYLKLWFVLSIQKKYEIAYEIYKKLLSIDENHLEALEMCSHLSLQLECFDACKCHSKLYLKQNPNNAEILKLLSDSLLILEEKIEALEILKKLKQLEPYNTQIRELIDKLETEFQLAHNFSSHQS